MTTDAFQKALADLSAEYRAGLPARLQEIDDLWGGAKSTMPPPQGLLRALHSIAGSARTFGLAELSDAARAAEQLLDSCCELGQPLPKAARAEFAKLLDAVRRAANPRQAI